MTKKIFIAIVIFVIIILGFLFRGYLGFRKTPPNEPNNVVVNPPPLPEPATTTNNGTSPGTVTKPPQYPPYSGRDPQEIRPVPEEVKLFTEDQKKKIYLDIENDGQAVKKDPGFFQGWVQGGLLKKVIGDYEGARDMWEYAGVIRPQNSVSFGNLGELYWRYLPNFPKSEQNFKIALKNKPDDIGAYVSLAELYYYSYKEKSSLAYPTLLGAIKTYPNSLDLMKAIAVLYGRDQNYAQALEWWKKVAAIDSSDASVAAMIKSLEEKTK